MIGWIWKCMVLAFQTGMGAMFWALTISMALAFLGGIVLLLDKLKEKKII